MVRCSFSNSNFEPVLVELEKTKPRGAHPSAARSEPRADCVWTVLTSSDSGRRHPARAHDTVAATSPPTVIATPPISAASATASCGYTWSAPPTSSLFSSFSFAHAPPRLLVTYRRQLPHPGPPSTFSSNHPAPVHHYNPSNSSPNNPSGPSPPLLPARRAPPWTARSSLSSTESTTPRALRR
jgi:hypothetical protein